MKLGIWLNPNYDPKIGGGFSYYSRLINGIDNHNFSNEVEIVFLREGKEIPQLNHPIIALNYTPSKPRIKDRIQLRIPFRRQIAKKRIQRRNEQEKNKFYCKQIQDANIKLIYYPIQTPQVLPNIPFIVSNWDIGHRSSWMFPELMQDGQFEWREYYYNTILPQALMILCESEAGRQELISYTRINPIRVKVMPLFSGNAIDSIISKEEQSQVLLNFNLSIHKYFYYPAQFWAHKNHYTLLHAFSLFHKNYPDYKLIFTGSNQGNQIYIQNICHTLGLSDSVIFGGFVSPMVVSTLYQNAAALVMPTLLGPTNMPLLEAMQLGCPVVCSNLPGHREELSESAIYINNPIDQMELYAAMEEVVLHNEKYRQRILSRRLECPFTLEKALQLLNNHFIEAIRIRNCWN